MTPGTLRTWLDSDGIIRSEVDLVVGELLDRPDLVKVLIDRIAIEDRAGTFYGSWVLDHLMRRRLEYLLPHMEKFTDLLVSLKNESCIRSLAHVCEMLCTAYFKKRDQRFIKGISDGQLERIMTVCFDWLISPMNTAPKVFAMGCLYHLGSKFDWVRPELQAILEESMAQGSTGYRSRAKKTLEMLSRSDP